MGDKCIYNSYIVYVIQLSSFVPSQPFSFVQAYNYVLFRNIYTLMKLQREIKKQNLSTFNDRYLFFLTSSQRKALAASRNELRPQPMEVQPHALAEPRGQDTASETNPVLLDLFLRLQTEEQSAPH